MKTYEETINHYAEEVFSKEMNGSHSFLGGVSYSIIAFIYGVSDLQVIDDLGREAKAVRKRTFSK